MTEDLFPDDAASRALTLAERAALLRRGDASLPSETPDDLARFRLEAWRKQSPFDRPGLLARRLEAAGLDERRFETVVAAPSRTWSAALDPPPAWVRGIREALRSMPRNGVAARDPEEAFLGPVRPLIDRAVRLVAGQAGEPAAAALSAGLDRRILAIVDRTLVLELNVARLEGRLEGGTPQERFRSFARRIAGRDGAATVLAEYPVLARLVQEDLARWARASLEFLDRLRADRPAIATTFFGGADPGSLVEADAQAGDPHREGRGVVLARFESGRRLVYKPRSVAVDARYQELLRRLARNGLPESLRTIAVLDRETHGWIEFVEPAPCSSEDDARRYHRRIGTLLAVFHLLEATDLHFENLIAAGDQPVAIDLETVFHPRPPRRGAPRADERLVERVLADSVVRTGLLPFRTTMEEGRGSADLSGIAAVAGQVSSDPVLRWVDVGTDSMRAVRERASMSGGRNLAVLDGRELDAADYADDVVQGYSRAYRFFRDRRACLLADDGPLRAFFDDEVRAVLRPTRAYGMLLDESHHPDFLRDALDRDRFLDRIWVGADDHPAYERVAPFEQRDLWAGDVPYFTARPGSRDVVASRGERIPVFFDRAPLDVVRDRIAGLEEGDLHRQQSLVRATLGIKRIERTGEAEERPYAPLPDLATPGEEALSASCLAAALRAAAHLSASAVRDGTLATWLSLETRAGAWGLSPLSHDLYAGGPGVALFLAYAADVAGEPELERLSRAAYATLLERVEHAPGEISQVGLFQGWGGIAYALAHAGALWNDPGMLRSAERALDRIASLADRDEDLDVVAGVAGSVAGALAVHTATGSSLALSAAARCGDRLIETARPHPEGLAWHTRIGPDEPQTGFSHGAAGIVAALSDLAAATGEGRFLEAARAGAAVERARLWPDIRRWLGSGAPEIERNSAPALEKSVATAWCYGAPGVGLSRVRLLRHGADRALDAEVDEAVGFTLERGFGRNHCLCHGDLGNLDFLLQASRLPGHAGLREDVPRIAARVLAGIARDGYLCGTPHHVDAPGLMNGVAGIGFGLLRLAAPDRVPSVLAMEAPRIRRSVDRR